MSNASVGAPTTTGRWNGSARCLKYLLTLGPPLPASVSVPWPHPAAAFYTRAGGTFFQGRRYRLRPGDKEEEQKLNLTFRMMLGVRVAVGRQADRVGLETLKESDFGQACMIWRREPCRVGNRVWHLIHAKKTTITKVVLRVIGEQLVFSVLIIV